MAPHPHISKELIEVDKKLPSSNSLHKGKKGVVFQANNALIVWRNAGCITVKAEKNKEVIAEVLEVAQGLRDVNPGSEAFVPEAYTVRK